MSLLRAFADDRLALYLHGEPGRGGMAPWQRAFHSDQATDRAIVAANQVGKSRAGAAEAWLCATGTHPWRNVPRNEGLGWICVATWGLPYQQVVRNLMATCPMDLVDWGRTTYVEDGNRFVNNQIILKDGFAIRFVPTGGGSTNASAGTVDWLWLDEPPARGKWGELRKRPSRWGGPFWATLTPWDTTQDLTWLRVELEGDPETGTPPAAPWQIFRVPFQPPFVPWLAPDHVARERAKTPAAESPIRNDGEWEGAIAGRYFAGYGPPYDTLPERPTDGAPWQLHVGADYGEGAGKTAAPISEQRRRKDGLPEIRFLAEYVSASTSTVTDDARGIAAALDGIGRRVGDVGRWVGDTNTLGKAAPGARVNAAMGAALHALAVEQEHARAAARRAVVRPVPRVLFDDADKRPGAPDTGWRLMAQALGMGLIHVDAARCPRLDRAFRRWKGLDDEHKHVLDGARYQVYELLLDTLGREQGGGRVGRLY